MDVSMPELDGFELADVIRQHPRFQKTAIIFISGVHLTDSDKIQGYRSGAVDYISVPVVPDVLRAKIGIFVELHRKTRMLETLNNQLEQRVAERTDELRRREEQFRTRAELLELATEAIMVRGVNGEVTVLECRSRDSVWLAARRNSGKDIHSVLRTVFPVPREEIETALRDKKGLARKSASKEERRLGCYCRVPKDHESRGRCNP